MQFGFEERLMGALAAYGVSEAFEIRFELGRFVVTSKSNVDPHSIIIYPGDEEWIVASDGWHAHLESCDEAVGVTVWMFSRFARVVQELKGGHLIATWAEFYGDSGWEISDEVFFLNPEDAHSWEKRGREKVMHRRHQHDLIPMLDAFQKDFPSAELKDGFPTNWRLGTITLEVAETEIARQNRLA